jgi:hypothetical protein
MKKVRFAAAGAGIAALVLATAALGGSGVGATFNLGETNTVNDTSVLTGNTPGTQLSVINSDDTHHALMAQNTGTGSGIALYGVHPSSSGNGPGVRGDTDSTDSNSYGVFGVATSAAPTSNTAGVRGRNNSANEFGFGVWGSQEGSGMGVYGTSVFGSGV